MTTLFLLLRWTCAALVLGFMASLGALALVDFVRCRKESRRLRNEHQKEDGL